MQISPIKNPNFEKPPRNLSNRTKGKILKKNVLDISQKNFGSAYAQSPRKCSNIEILAKIELFYELLSMLWYANTEHRHQALMRALSVCIMKYSCTDQRSLLSC
jgi:hypothetical protein